MPWYMHMNMTMCMYMDMYMDMYMYMCMYFAGAHFHLPHATLHPTLSFVGGLRAKSKCKTKSQAQRAKTEIKTRHKTCARPETSHIT